VWCVGALVLAACGGGDDTERSGGDPTGDGATDEIVADDTGDDTGDDSSDDTGDDTSGGGDGEGWTVLVYSIADTDLEPYMMDDITEMGGVGSGPGVNIVGLVDRASSYSSDPVLGIDDWVGAKLLHIGQGEAEVLAELGDLNTGDPQVLADFIATGIAEYPAARYSLVIADHGAGWPGAGGDESAGHDLLTLAEMEAGITAGLEAAGVDKFDMLGFDACLMATYEVASTLAPVADRLLASQELEPGHGWDYSALQILNDDPDTDVDTLGVAIIDAFEAVAQSEGTDNEITLSLVDLTQMPAIDAAMNDFTTVLTESAAALGPIIGRTRSTTLGFGRNPDPTADTHMVDLGILVSEIGVQALNVSDQADSVIRAINDSVIHTVAGAATRGATGLSIYFPPEAQWFSQDYTGLDVMGGWNGFLDAYYAGGAAIPVEEQPQFISDEAEIFFDEDGLNIAGQFDLAAEGNITTASIDYGVVEEDGSVTFIGTEPAEVADDGSGLALGIFDLTVLTVSDGVDTSYAYLDLTIDEEAQIATVDVPMAYYPPGSDDGYGDVLLSLVFDAEGSLLSETYYVYDEALGTYGELTADPEGLIVPSLLSVGLDGSFEWVPSSDVGLYADLPSLSYDLESLPSGTELYVELTVTDFGGNSDFVSSYVTIP
jgi:hypothetical protein